jgi:methionyl-tRNA synthetase
VLGIAIQPFVPDSAAKILAQLKVSDDARDYSFMSKDHMLKSGTQIDQPEGVFPRLETSEKAA